MRPAPLLLALALVACEAPVDTLHDGSPDAPNALTLHDVDAGGAAAEATAHVARLERLDADGPFLEGATERFQVIGLGEADVRWEASGGRLESDGDLLTWILPEGETLATLRGIVSDGAGSRVLEQRLQLIAVPGGAAGAVDTTGEPTGSTCALAIDTSDVPHVIYRNDRHAQWWYARYTGGSWQTELIDGPGFGVGDGADSADPDIVIDSAGRPRVAFLRDDGELVYGIRSAAGAWTLEAMPLTVDNSNVPVSIILDGAANDMPHLFASESIVDNAIAFWKAGGTWQSSANNVALNTTEFHHRGGVALAGPGSFWISLGEDDAAVVQFSRTGGWSDFRALGFSLTNSQTYRQPMISAAPSTVGMFDFSNLYWSTNSGTSFDAFEAHPGGQYDKGLAYDGSDPHVAVFHDGALEFATPDARGYWDYVVVATGAGETLDVALDTSGNLHACFRKDSTVWFQ